jgi:hypothetical protein
MKLGLNAHESYDQGKNISILGLYFETDVCEKKNELLVGLVKD